MKKNANKGFSLVELIIVIAIMAVLVGVLAGQFIPKIEQSRESTDMQNVQALRTAVEAYVASNESNTDNIQIKVIGGSGTGKQVIEIYKGTAKSAVPVQEAGLTESTKLKSAGWGDATFTYYVTESSTGAKDAYTWKASASCTNSKDKDDPKKDMKSVFGL